MTEASFWVFFGCVTAGGCLYLMFVLGVANFIHTGNPLDEGDQ